MAETHQERLAAQQRRTSDEIYRISGMFTRTRVTAKERADYANSDACRDAKQRGGKS